MKKLLFLVGILYYLVVPGSSMAGVPGFEFYQEQDQDTSAYSKSKSIAEIKDSANNNNSNEIQIKYPLTLPVGQILVPRELSNDIFTIFYSFKNLMIKNTSIIFMHEGNEELVRYAVYTSGAQPVSADQNHGKKFFANLRPRSSEFLGPLEQLRELVDRSPNAKTIVVDMHQMTQTRGYGGVAGTGEVTSNMTSVLTSNGASSYRLPFVMLATTGLNKVVKLPECWAKEKPQKLPEEACYRMIYVFPEERKR